MFMKKGNKSLKVILSFLLLGVLSITISCSNNDIFSMDYDNLSNYSRSYIELPNINKQPLTVFEKEQFKEAAYRFSCRLMFEKDNSISLMEGTTANELKISAELFKLFNDVIDLWNENPTTLITKKGKISRTKGDDPESTSTRGGNLIYDIVATTIYNRIVSNGWIFTAKLFYMWYFDNNSNTYTLTEEEWLPIATYSKNSVDENFKNNPFTYQGSTYYQNIISFYDASDDLHFALGSSTITINDDGYAVGLYDYYDFNAGDPPLKDETIVFIIRTIGDKGGFPVKFGIVKP